MIGRLDKIIRSENVRCGCGGTSNEGGEEEVTHGSPSIIANGEARRAKCDGGDGKGRASPATLHHPASGTIASMKPDMQGSFGFFPFIP
jgi:hypothetical protein